MTGRSKTQTDDMPQLYSERLQGGAGLKQTTGSSWIQIDDRQQLDSNRRQGAAGLR